MRTTLLMGLMSLVVIASAVAQTAGPTVTPLAAPAEPRGTPWGWARPASGSKPGKEG